MWEAFLSIALFGSFVWWSIITAVILLILFVSEVKSQEGSGWISLVALIAYFIIFYFWGNKDIGILLDWKFLLLYLGIGFVYTLIRTYFFGRSSKNKVQENINTSYSGSYNTKESAVNYKKREREEFIEKLKVNVFRWWFIWPISLIVWTLSDLVRDVWNWIYANIRKIFEGIFMLGFGKDEDVIPKE